jgi:tetratricopeptide (TPR) repeat protein
MMCPNCGLENRPGAAFCRKCGKHLKGASPGPRRPDKEKPPASPLPPEPPRRVQPPEPPDEIRGKPRPAAGADSAAGKGAGNGNGAVRVKLTPRKSPAPLALIAILIFAGLIVWRLWFSAGSGPKQEPEAAAAVDIGTTSPYLMILPFCNRTGDEDWTIWEKGIVHALAVVAAQSDLWDVVQPEALEAVLGGSDERIWRGSDLGAKAGLAKRVGAAYFLSGGLDRDNGGFSLKIQLARTREEEVWLEEIFEIHSNEEILARLQDVASSVFDRMSDSGKFKGTLKPVAEILTFSADAFKHFVRGRELYFAGRFQDGTVALQQALQLDDGFVPARLALADAYEGLGLFGRARNVMQSSQGLIERVCERGRYHLQGEFYRRSEKTYDIAASIYRRLVEIHPHDLVGRIRLDVMEQKLGLWAGRENGPRVSPPPGLPAPDLFLDFQAALTREGVLSDFGRQSKHWAGDPGGGRAAAREASILMLIPDLDGAWKLVQKQREAPLFPGITRVRGEILQLQDQAAAAESEYGRLLESEGIACRMWARRRRANLLAQGGRFQPALAEIEQGLRLAADSGEADWIYRFHLESARLNLLSDFPDAAFRDSLAAWESALAGETGDFPRKALLFRGLAELRMNRVEDARKTAEELRSLCEKGPAPNRMRDYFHLSGAIAMAAENADMAVDYFSRAVDRLPPEDIAGSPENDHAFHLNALASAFYRSRVFGRALDAYRRLTELGTGRLDFGDLYSRSYYMMGLIAQSQGDSAEAERNFRRFLDLWAPAGESREEIRDARRRLAALR